MVTIGCTGVDVCLDVGEYSIRFLACYFANSEGDIHIVVEVLLRKLASMAAKAASKRLGP